MYLGEEKAYNIFWHIRKALQISHAQQVSNNKLFKIQNLPATGETDNFQTRLHSFLKTKHCDTKHITVVDILIAYFPLLGEHAQISWRFSCD